MASSDAQRAYLDGLRMLAARDRTEAQLRERLARGGHSADAVSDAVARLTAEGALDEARTARALARRQVTTRRHGRARVQRELEAAGVPPALARTTLDEVFAEVDENALIDDVLSRRLRRAGPLDDPQEFRRVFRYLVGQGFDGDRVLRTLRTRRRT